jgi:hypothetical protein
VLVHNSKNIEINKPVYPTDTKLFLKVSGGNNIKVDQTLVNTGEVAKW